MVLLRRAALAAVVFNVSALAAGVVGTPSGFASGTTGGGDATPAAPSDIAELTEWLTDDTPRVILIDKLFNYVGSEGTVTNGTCCIPDSNTCGASGQNALVTSLDWCDPYPKTTCSYDTAGQQGIDVASNKSIVGVGSDGVIKGRGLRFTNDVSNIIVQNVHLTYVNPQYIWGGDLIYMNGCDNIWIDHVKLSLVGRQMISMGFESSGRVTISNTEFDGQTPWSSSCDGHHYWTILGLGTGDTVSFYNNWVHHTSGRSPDLGYPNTWHLYNNLWTNNTGHAFEVSADPSVLIEGNVFVDIKTPMNPGDQAGVFAVNSTTAAACKEILGRDCVENIFDSASGSLTPSTESNTTTLTHLESLNEGAVVTSTDDVESYVMANAGIGKMNSNSTVTSDSAYTSTTKSRWSFKRVTPANLDY